MQEDVSSSYLQKTVSIAESTEDPVPEEDVTGPSARDKVLAAAPPRYVSNGASQNGSTSSSVMMRTLSICPHLKRTGRRVIQGGIVRIDLLFKAWIFKETLKAADEPWVSQFWVVLSGRQF